MERKKVISKINERIEEDLTSEDRENSEVDDRAESMDREEEQA